MDALGRFRLQFKFWLDMGEQAEIELAATIEELKTKRTFTQTVRDGIRLVMDLRAGKTDVLNELFPWVLEAKPATDNAQVMSKLDALARQLLNAEPATMQHKPKPVVAIGGDDLAEGLEIKQAVSDENPSYNMIISMAGLTGNWADLPTEVLEYGVKKGRVPTIAQEVLKGRTPPPQAAPIVAQSKGDAKAMQGADVELAPPPDDDIDLDIEWGE